MEIRQAMRRLLPASRARAAPAPDTQTKVVLADYYAALQSAGIYTGYRSKPWPVERAVAEAYERVVWVYKSVESISAHAAQLPFRLRQGEEVVDDHPLYRVLNKKANPLETGRQFRKRLSAQILLSKRGAFVEVTRSRGGDVIRLDLLPPGRTMPIPGTGQDLISHYEVLRADGTRNRIEVENVRWFREPHPLDPYCGVTPLEAAGMSVELDFFTRLYNVAFLKNDARPGGVLAINGEMGDDEMNRIESRFSKGAVEAGKLTVISGEVSYTDLASQPRDMQYETTSSISKKEILTAFGVPESVIGDASGRTWDNAEQELYNYWSLTMPPHLDMLLTGLDEDSDDDLVGFFDTEGIEVLQRTKKFRREEARAEFLAGLISIDEYREIAGYELVDNEYTRAFYVATNGKQTIPTSDEDAEAFGLAEEEAAVQEVELAAATAAAAVPPDQAAAQAAATADKEPAKAPEKTPAPAEAPAKKAPADAKPAPAKKHLTALPALPPAVAEPVRFGRPVIRMVRPAVSVKAAPITADSDPDNGARDELEAALTAALSALSLRLTARAATRLASPKSRKGTRHWTPEYDVDSRVGTKELDAEAAVDAQRWQEETEQTAQPLIEAAAVAAGVALLADFGASPLPMPDTVAPVVAAIVRTLGASAAVQAARLTKVIRDADAAGTPLEELKTTVRSYATRMTAWADAVSIQAATATANGARSATAQAWIDEAPGRTVNAMWNHRGDAIVRKTHKTAGGQIRPLGETFLVGDSWLRFPGDPDGPPHEVYSCFPADTLVDAPDGLTGAIRAPYKGEMVTLTTKSGRRLTGTPNHPVLTHRGWVPLGALHVGDNLVHRLVGDTPLPALAGAPGAPDIQHTPTAIGQVYGSLAQKHNVRRVLGASVDFYGDRPTGDVDVVGADGQLGFGLDRVLPQKVAYEVFSESDEPEIEMASRSSHMQFTFGGNPSPSSIIGGGDQSLPVLRAQRSHAGEHGLRPVAALNARDVEPSVHGAAVDAAFGRELLYRLPVVEFAGKLLKVRNGDTVAGPTSGDADATLTEPPVGGAGLYASGLGENGQVEVTCEVVGDEVIDLTRAEDWSGHVYTISTRSGIYSANGLIVANCRCWLNHRSAITGKFVPKPEGAITRMTRADREAVGA